MPPTSPVADLISANRRQRGLSIREAARRATAYNRVSEGTWRRYESPDPGIPRDPVKLAAMAAAISITPQDLAGCGHPEAAAELERLMERAAAHPDVRSGLSVATGEGWTELMSEILAGIGDIDAAALPASVKSDLRKEFIASLARVAAERRRHMRVVRDASVNGRESGG